MELAECFPAWDRLTDTQREQVAAAAHRRSAAPGTLLHGGQADCTRLLLVCSGQLRAYVLSDEGREITLYRLLARDVCLFSASCMLRSVQFEIQVEAEKAAELWVIPPDLIRALMEQAAPLANCIGEIMASRFSDVMWLMDQILWKSVDRRLAAFLCGEAALEQSETLRITHEKIAGHLGTAREVVTRMLRYFQSEGMVQLSRGVVTITDAPRLRQLGGM